MTLLEKGADANLLGTRDAAAIHLAAGAECHSDNYTALMLSYSANPNVPYVSCFFLLVMLFLKMLLTFVCMCLFFVFWSSYSFVFL